MSTLRDAPNAQRSDGFQIFEAFCEAANITPGVDRIGIFLALPEPLQDQLWTALADRLEVPTERD